MASGPNHVIEGAGRRFVGFVPTHEIRTQPNVVERRFNRLEQFRGLATRYARRATHYQAELTIAATVDLVAVRGVARRTEENDLEMAPRRPFPTPVRAARS
jgi:hypothetical protein